MNKIKLTIIIILLFITLPGCLIRYGEGRLDQLLLSVDELEKECEANGEELTEEKIKEKLGKPGLLKPIYETSLDFSILETLLYKLKEDAGFLLVPNRAELYEDMIVAIKEGRCRNIKLLSYVYDKTGSLEESAIAFYIGNINGNVKDEPVVFGWDYVKYGNKDLLYQIRKRKRKRKVFCNYKIDNPADFLRLSYSFLIDTVIGLKQFAGETIKSPFSFLEEELLKNMIIDRKIPFYKLDGFKPAIEDWRNGITALTYRYRVDGNQGVLATTQNLLGEVPLVGSVFDQWHRKENSSANKLFLSRGIFGGDVHKQNTSLWVQYFKKRPEYTKYDNKPFIVEAIPYKFGSIVDVLWALLNISHGYAYDMASEIVFTYDTNPGDTVLLSGHSGGVQRNIATARILNDDGIKVEKIYGIAGPALGYAPSKKTKVVLNRRFLDDPVSDVSRFLKYITLNLLTLNIKWDYDDRVSLKRGIAYKHVTPGFVESRRRVKYNGYLHENFNFFCK